MEINDVIQVKQKVKKLKLIMCSIYKILNAIYLEHNKPITKKIIAEQKIGYYSTMWKAD